MTSPEITDAAVEAAIKAGQMEGWDYIDLRMRDALTAALPHLAAGRAEAVAVKPLEWVEEVADMWWTADCYRVETCDAGGFAARVAAPASRSFRTLAFGVSFEAAKAAAQADYETRIRSALVSAPAAEAEPAGYAGTVGDMLAAPSASQEALREARDEYGWLIEHGTSPVSSPAYYAGGGNWANEPYDPRRSSAWTSNHLHAIRFARKLDAERFAERAMAGIPVRVCEHAWDAALAQSAPVKAGG